MIQKPGADQMRRNALKRADTKIFLWRPEINRLQLAMQIGQMKQCHLPLTIEIQQVILAQPLLCGSAGKVWYSGKITSAHGGHLKKFTT
jgi:hypothetical protein